MEFLIKTMSFVGLMLLSAGLVVVETLSIMLVVQLLPGINNTSIHWWPTIFYGIGCFLIGVTLRDVAVMLGKEE